MIELPSSQKKTKTKLSKDDPDNHSGVRERQVDEEERNASLFIFLETPNSPMGIQKVQHNRGIHVHGHDMALLNKRISETWGKAVARRMELYVKAAFPTPLQWSFPLDPPPCCVGLTSSSFSSFPITLPLLHPFPLLTLVFSLSH